jgi:ABC-2 type transport system ATP-binding protein
MEIIKVSDLSKTYKSYCKEVGLKGSIQNFFHRKIIYKEAVKSINFSISEGEVVGFLGSNGSGKTTTLKMLSGILYPTSGSAEVLGYTPWERKNDFKRQFAIVMGQKSQIWWDLPPIESFDLIRTIYKLNINTYNRNLEELIYIMGVENMVNTPTRNLSLGERMKMELIAALLHQPKVLFLDEPTIGLDFISRKNIQQFIKVYNKKKKTTIILTSHYMSDIEVLCDRLVIINKGEIMFDGSLEDIKKENLNEKLVKIKHESIQQADVFQKFGLQVSQTELETVLRVNAKRIGEIMNLAYNELSGIDLSIEEIPMEHIVEKFYSMNGEMGIDEQ